MDLRKEAIKTEGPKPLLDAFQFIGVIIIINNNTLIYNCQYVIIAYKICKLLETKMILVQNASLSTAH